MGVHTVYHIGNKNVKDYRNKDGIVYEGSCVYCGGTYYAKRRTARYCSKECWTMAQKFIRIELPDGRVRLEPIEKEEHPYIEEEESPTIKERKEPKKTSKSRQEVKEILAKARAIIEKEKSKRRKYKE